MIHEHLFFHTHIVPLHIRVCERYKMWVFCVCGDHMDTCHNCTWVYKWYMPPKVVFVSLLLYTWRKSSIANKINIWNNQLPLSN